MDDTTIKKYYKNTGRFFHKAPRGGASKAKSYAMSDISKECSSGSFYTKNYLIKENIVLQACACKVQFITINTCLL
jgi:hypothetical protein